VENLSTQPGAAATPHELDFRGAGRTLGSIRALDAIDLVIRRGERVAIVGPSGAGKTTLLRLAGASMFASTGDVRVLGEDPSLLRGASLRSLRARIGTVHQQLQLVPQASVLENVLLGRVGTQGILQLALAPMRRVERARVTDLLDRVGLGPRLDERVDRLSGGEQQRVAVARVLWQQPELVLADEPFSSVDPGRSAEVVRLLLAASEGRTLVVSTHQIGPIRTLVDRFVGLRAGRLLFDLPREALTEERLAGLYRIEGPA
jgi:phosphonate transport system ATP-binding protein